MEISNEIAKEIDLLEDMNVMQQDFKKSITAKAKELGFNLVGFTNATPDSKSVKAFNSWLVHKYEGSMTYMQKSKPRENLKEILPEAESVITFAVNYYREQPDQLSDDEGRIARYAYGRDYHKIIGGWLKKMAAYIKELDPKAEVKTYVDTGPVLERSFAEQAGLGVIGKNACLITPEFGSWVFLAEMITNIDFDSDSALVNLSTGTDLKKDFSACGGCTRCIDACPTGAIIAPGVIDSRKCISYLTIENREDEIPEEYRKIIKETKRIYGCDICQEVCPHNIKKQRIQTHPNFQKPIAGSALSRKQTLALKNDEEFLEKYAGSPLMRAKRNGLQRNVKLI